MERGEKWEGTLGTVGFEGSTILFLHFFCYFFHCSRERVQG